MKNVIPRALCAAVLMVGLAGGPVAAHTQAAHRSVATTSRSHTITIENFKFEPPKSVAPGARVKVVNLDGALHTVTAVNGSFQAVVQGGATGHFTAPSQPGRYRFYCAIHYPHEKGMLVVR